MPTTITANRYAQVLRAIEEAHKKRSLEMAKEIAEMAKRFAPVKTGALRDSIEVQSDRHTGEAHVVVGVPYGPVVEYGSAVRNTPAQPYMTPATESVRQRYKKKPLKIRL
jgi:HK97 gp10 family phage protein